MLVRIETLRCETDFASYQTSVCEASGTDLALLSSRRGIRMGHYSSDATERATRLSVHMISMYRYLWTCQAERRGGRRLGALCTMLALLTLLVVSGPHLVHHLADLSPQHDHHTPTGSTPPPPDCLVFFVMQHTPVAAGVLAHALTPLAVGEPIVCTPPLWMSEAPRYVSQARAPPPVFLPRTLSKRLTLYESAA